MSHPTQPLRTKADSKQQRQLMDAMKPCSVRLSKVKGKEYRAGNVEGTATSKGTQKATTVSTPKPVGKVRPSTTRFGPLYQKRVRPNLSRPAPMIVETIVLSSDDEVATPPRRVPPSREEPATPPLGVPATPDPRDYPSDYPATPSPSVSPPPNAIGSSLPPTPGRNINLGVELPPTPGRNIPGHSASIDLDSLPTPGQNVFSTPGRSASLDLDLPPTPGRDLPSCFSPRYASDSESEPRTPRGNRRLENLRGELTPNLRSVVVVPPPPSPSRGDIPFLCREELSEEVKRKLQPCLREALRRRKPPQPYKRVFPVAGHKLRVLINRQGKIIVTIRGETEI
ncbi:uncharacterized protein isoform X2 [Musca autumnalis]